MIVDFISLFRTATLSLSHKGASSVAERKQVSRLIR